MTAQPQVRFDTGLDCHQGQFAQMGPLGISETGIGELGQRLPAAQPERLAQNR